MIEIACFVGHRNQQLEAAEQTLEQFAEKWDAKYPTIAPIWRRNWQRVIPFVAFPDEVRKIIYTTNAVESLNMSLRKALKPHQVLTVNTFLSRCCLAMLTAHSTVRPLLTARSRRLLPFVAN